MICEYKHCRHKDNTQIKEFDGHWYHEDCYQERQDLMYILYTWRKRINKEVNPGDLYKHMYALFEKHPSNYIVFCLEYAIDNHKNLNYPAGLKFYVDKTEFKEAYKAAQNRKAQKEVKKYKIVAKEPQEEVKQTFIPQEDKGFSAILGH